MHDVTILPLNSQNAPTRCNRVVEFIVSMFLNSSTCFGRHTAHHQELKNCNYTHRNGRQSKTCVKPETAIKVFELLIMGDLSPETCWAIKKHWNNKFYHTLVSCSFFLWVLYYDTLIHEHSTITELPKKIKTYQNNNDLKCLSKVVENFSPHCVFSQSLLTCTQTSKFVFM
jgi:hypothetical protein